MTVPQPIRLIVALIVLVVFAKHPFAAAIAIWTGALLWLLRAPIRIALTAWLDGFFGGVGVKMSGVLKRRQGRAERISRRRAPRGYFPWPDPDPDDPLDGIGD